MSSARFFFEDVEEEYKGDEQHFGSISVVLGGEADVAVKRDLVLCPVIVAAGRVVGENELGTFRHMF